MPFIRNCFIFVCLFVTFFTYAQERDKPQKGEGIHAFLRRHNRDNNQYYQKFVKRNKGKFGKKNALLSGVFYDLPPIDKDSDKPKVSDAPEDLDILDTNISGLSGERNNIERQTVKDKKSKSGYQPLFGQKYAHYTILNDELKGACFFLSSGHGGPDCGAFAKVNGKILCEDEYAYDVTLRLARNLLQRGATVHIIIQDPKDGIRDGKYLENSSIETCMGSRIPLKQVKRLRQRTDKINALNRKAKEKYRRAVFIHLDSRGKKKQLDVYFYYQDKQKNKVKSKRLSETMRGTFADRYAKVQPGRGFSGTVSTRNLAVLRNAEPVSIFMELANMKNEFDQRRYILDDNRQALANWMTLGFIRDYHNSK
ncbi:MAG: N-acetylmuramoyl-L-alanine amidase [Candidatus Symbiothrix sp.]|jgi:N-acetylmuramoyl-L-alanine amidase|nr:N-acetylmuramoyl-L-alanine amidase [Candidatus Symbiothrix sp.]